MKQNITKSQAKLKLSLLSHTALDLKAYVAARDNALDSSAT